MSPPSSRPCPGLLGSGVDGGGDGGGFCPPELPEPLELKLLLFASVLNTEGPPMESLQEHNNAKLAYEYTESYWKTISASVDVVTTKLTATLGFSGLLLKFTADLSNQGLYLRLKISACVLLILAIVICGIGLAPKGSGKNLVQPDDLLETAEWYRETDELCRLYIARGWSKAIKKLEETRTFRVRCLGWAISALGITIICSAVITIFESIQ